MKRFLLLLPVLAGVMWGSVGIFVRTLTQWGIDSNTLLTSRFLVAVVILFVGILCYRPALLNIRLGDLWLFLGSGLLSMLGLNYCYNAAINQLTLSFAAVLLSLSPVFVLFLAALLFREPLTRRKIFCMILAFVGCVLTSGLLNGTPSNSWTVMGILLGLLAALFYGLYSIFSKFAGEKGYHVLTIIFYSLLFIAIVLLPFTDWQALASFWQAAPVKHSFFFLLHSLFSSVLPYVLYTLALNYGEAGPISILAAGGEPIAAMVFGLIDYQEKPTVLSVLGLALTIFALALLCRSKESKAKSA